MKVLILFFGSIAILLNLCACTPPQVIKVELIQINSIPPGAEVFINGNLHGNTPTTINFKYDETFSSDGNLQSNNQILTVKLNGYYPFEFIFDLSKNEGVKIPNPIVLERHHAENVSITGAASSLTRITTGGPHEIITDISPESRWILLQMSESGENASRERVISKLDLERGAKILLSSSSSDSFDAVYSKDMKSVIFCTNRLGMTTLVQSLGVSGESGVRFITQPSLGHAKNPSISPTHNEISFSIRNNSGSGTLAIVNFDGTNLRMFGEGTQPTWSPDGKYLAFVRKVGNKNKIFTMNAENGAELVELSSVSSNDHTPVWSPEGKRIAFISDRVNGRYHLFVMDLHGGNISQITDGDFDIASMVWGKNNALYFSANAGKNWDIWRVNYN